MNRMLKRQLILDINQWHEFNVMSTRHHNHCGTMCCRNTVVRQTFPSQSCEMPSFPDGATVVYRWPNVVVSCLSGAALSVFSGNTLQAAICSIRHRHRPLHSFLANHLVVRLSPLISHHQRIQCQLKYATTNYCQIVIWTISRHSLDYSVGWPFCC